MDRDIAKRTLRIEEGLYSQIKQEADRINSSYNSFLMVLIALGLKVYKSDVVICKDTIKRGELI